MASLYSPNSFSFAPEQLRQVINPLSWLTSGTGQIGLFNVYQTATSKPEVEAEIVKNVAGYGRQLGRITDLLQVMLREPDRGKWSASDEAVSVRFPQIGRADCHREGEPSRSDGREHPKARRRNQLRTGCRPRRVREDSR